MIESNARVIAVEPGYAWIESERRSGCSHCESAASCGVSSVSKLFGIRRLQLRLADPLGVSPGETVVIGLSERRLVGAAAVAYMLPLLAMVTLALAGVALGQGQGVIALLSFAGLGAGLGIARRRTVHGAAGTRPLLLRRHGLPESPIEFKPVMQGDHDE